MRVIVVGAGILGASVAERLTANDGVHVTVLDQDRPASGTSGTSFAWVNSNAKAPEAYHELNAAGMAEFARRRAELGGTYHPVGHLEIATETPAVERLAARATALAATGYRAEPISAARLRELEPALTLPAEPELVVHFPDEGYCDADRLVRHLLDAVERRGGAVRTGIGPVELTGGAGVRLASGERLTADRVVSCTGRWSAEVAGIPMDAGPRVGALLAVTASLARRPSAVISTPGLNLRRHHEGGLMLQALDLDRREPDAQAAAEFSARARALLPSADDLRLDSVRRARRAIPADGLTVAGWLDPAERMYAIATHSGVTLSLLLGRLAAAEVLDGRPAELLEPFRPGRFDPLGTQSNPTAS